MPDPLILSGAAIGSAALTEGIKFLYAQAGEILKRWRDRREKSKDSEAEPVSLELPQNVFEGNVPKVTIHFDAVEQSESSLRELRKRLSDYADGIDRVDQNDMDLLRTVASLRGLLEVIWRQHLTFRGENRPASGSPLVLGQVDVKGSIADEATGVDAESVVSGDVRGEVKAERVEKGGKAIGVKATSIGAPPSGGS